MCCGSLQRYVLQTVHHSINWSIKLGDAQIVPWKTSKPWGCQEHVELPAFLFCCLLLAPFVDLVAWFLSELIIDTESYE
eukprot:5548974-Amphidinium_carterae.2